jgi:hypothetical protein
MGVAILSVRTPEGRRTLSITDIIDVHLPRHLTWGPSEHILNVAREDIGERARFTFELQRGDTPVIQGASIAYVDTARAEPTTPEQPGT